MRNSRPLRLSPVVVLVSSVLVCGVFGDVSEGKQKDGSAKGSKATAAQEKKGGKPRPSDLDPRIPWMEDIGMAQSGGRDPLVVVGVSSLPKGIEGTDATVLLPSGRVVILWSPALVVLERDGTERWRMDISRLGNGGVCSVIPGPMGLFYLGMGCFSPGGSASVVALREEDGDTGGKWQWSAEGGGEPPRAAVYHRGLVVAETYCCGRIHVPVAQSLDVDPDDVLIASVDVHLHMKGKNPRFMRVGVRRPSYARWDMRGKKGRDLNLRKRRVSAFVGRRLRIASLPFSSSLEPKPGYDRTFLRGAEVIAVDANGGMAVWVWIDNPHGLSAKDMSTFGAPREKRRGMVVWFGKDGGLVRYLILGMNQEPKSCSVNGSRICVIDAEANQVLFWAPQSSE